MTKQKHKLQQYVVLYYIDNRDTEEFFCMAENEDHAIEQAKNADERSIIAFVNVL